MSIPANPQSITKKQIIKGIIYSNLFAVACFALAYWIMNWNEGVGFVLSFSEFVLVPIAMGVIAMKFWITPNTRLLPLFPYALINSIIAIAFSALFMGEGIICILIVSPLVLAFMWIGVIIGKHIMPRDKSTLKISTALVFVVLFAYDTFSEHNYRNVVTDEITINAPREVVWKYVAAHPLNTTEPGYWLFRVGLPNPIQSTVTADTVGAERKCVFSNGATFDEIIVESIRDSVFTFDIVKQPHDPEIIGHIEIRRGQFILEDNVDGTTRLIGKSWYRLMVYPSWYYDLWATDITREVHIRVMNHIKTLAENDV